MSSLVFIFIFSIFTSFFFDQLRQAMSGEIRGLLGGFGAG